MLKTEAEAINKLRLIWAWGDKKQLEEASILRSEISELRRWYTEWRLEYNIETVKNIDVRIIAKHLILNRENSIKLKEKNEELKEKNRKLQQAVESLTGDLYN